MSEIIVAGLMWLALGLVVVACLNLAKAIVRRRG